MGLLMSGVGSLSLQPPIVGAARPGLGLRIASLFSEA